MESLHLTPNFFIFHGSALNLLIGVIAKIAAFIGARTDEEHLEQVYQRCTLAYMGNPEHKAKFNHDWERRIMQRFAWEMAVLVVTENASSLA